MHILYGLILFFFKESSVLWVKDAIICGDLIEIITALYSIALPGFGGL